MSIALILRDDTARSIAFTSHADSAREDALSHAALIGTVSNPAQQAEAVAAQQKIKSLRNDVEKARKAAKDPVLQFGRLIDDSAAQFDQPLREEELRISKLIGDYVTHEEQKARAAEAAQRKELDELERKKQAALAEAVNHDEADKIQAQYNAEAAAVAPPPAPPRAKGQVVRQDYDVEVFDIHALYRSHPNLVTLTPRLEDIKALAKLGQKIAGVRATQVTKSTVRAGRQPLILENS
jgi:hypothetical protein